MIRYIFGTSFKQFSLSFPDENRNKGVAETAPLKFLFWEDSFLGSFLGSSHGSWNFGEENPAQNIRLRCEGCCRDMFINFKALSVLMLCAPVFIFTSGSSALLGSPRCVLSIWLSPRPIFNALFSVYANCFTIKRTKHENTRSPPFSYDTKMAADGYLARSKALILRGLL